MAPSPYVAASFSLLRDATAAIDWFRNQAILPDDIVVAVREAGRAERPPQRGDSDRDDLTWIVALDPTAARLPAAIVRGTLQREGGKLFAWAPTPALEHT